MKITKELKLIMQFNSFCGMVAAVYLLVTGLHTTIAWVGLGINAYCLVYWNVVKEDE